MQITYLVHLSEDLDGHRTSNDDVTIAKYPSWTRRRSVLENTVVKAASSDAI